MSIDVGTIQESLSSRSPDLVGSRAKKLRAIILLSGGVRQTQLARGLGRPILDLPLPGGKSLLSTWRDQAVALAEKSGVSSLAVRVIVSKPLALPRNVPAKSGVVLSLEYDKIELRGTGGLVRDLAEDYADDDEILVASANQVLLQPLHELHAKLAALNADICLLSEPGGGAVGLHLMRCGALREIRAKGYIDLKEQALPQLVSTCDVRVAASNRAVALPMRTLEQYIRTLRALSDPSDIISAPDPYVEEWTPTFSLVDENATVSKNALVHDSVVMTGAKVGSGAVLVRSLVCEGAVVESGKTVFDTIIPASPRVNNAGGKP
jgi:hypothetical protein